MNLDLVKKGDRFKPFWKTELPKAGINTPLRLAAYFAQCDHESMGFTAVTEILNYSEDGLINTFPKYFSRMPGTGKAHAAQYARKPEKIANLVYANRMGNGNEASGEGWKYRGRGIIQLTGKSNYAAYSPLAVINPDIVSQPEHAVKSSIWFWTSRNLNRLADVGDTVGITRIINGGVNGLSHRQQLYQQYLTIFK
jgi:putative chitinase